MSIRERAERIASVKEQFIARLTSETVVSSAIAENVWFSRDDIVMAVGAIAREMLSLDKLISWSSRCKEPLRRLDVGVICAGNLPLVGFLDLLAVVVSGHRVLYSLSSKDRVLMSSAIELLSEALGDSYFAPLEDKTPINAVIATGSSSSEKYFKWMYNNLPQVVRGSRSSMALVKEDDGDDLLDALWSDIFTYKGLGCRNVSKLLLPRGYSISKITNIWRSSGRCVDSSEYRGSYIQNRALLEMCGKEYYDGGYFTVREDDNSLQPLSEIRTIYYNTIDEAKEYIMAHDEKLQCLVASDSSLHPRTVPFGMAQQPALDDWADGVDLFNFLNSLD